MKVEHCSLKCSSCLARALDQVFSAQNDYGCDVGNMQLPSKDSLDNESKHAKVRHAQEMVGQQTTKHSN